MTVFAIVWRVYVSGLDIRNSWRFYRLCRSEGLWYNRSPRIRSSQGLYWALVVWHFKLEQTFSETCLLYTSDAADE